MCRSDCDVNSHPALRAPVATQARTATHLSFLLLSSILPQHHTFCTTSPLQQQAINFPRSCAACIRDSPICDDLQPQAELGISPKVPRYSRTRRCFIHGQPLSRRTGESAVPCRNSCTTSDWRAVSASAPAVPEIRLQEWVNQRLPFDCRSGPKIKHAFKLAQVREVLHLVHLNSIPSL